MTMFSRERKTPPRMAAPARPQAILMCDVDGCQWAAQMFGDSDSEITEFLIKEFREHYACHPGRRFPFDWSKA